MEENRRNFGRMPDGTQVEELTLENGRLSCKVITYGGAVRSLVVPDRNGNPVDVALGFDTLKDYRAQDKYMGALVGRYANRIGGARFTLNGTEYTLAANDGPNSLHGGAVGFDKQVWTVEGLTDRCVTLSLVSPDGEEGYPGTLTVRVTYSLEEDKLRISYWAKGDGDTICNLTNHSYFNLSGHDSGSVEGQYIQLRSTHYTPVGPGSIPTGELAPVEGTPMDLRSARKIGESIDEPFHQLTMAGGYDHNWAVPPREYKQIGLAYAADTGIAMSVYSDMAGVQFYTGNFLDGCPPGKGGAIYGNRHGFCLETQFYPDTPNKPGFPPCVLRAGEEFTSLTDYRFFHQDNAEGP